MKTAETMLKAQQKKQETEKKEQEQTRQRAQEHSTVRANAMAQLLAQGRVSLTGSGLMDRALAQRIGNAAMIALMGEDGYAPEHLPKDDGAWIGPPDEGEDAAPEEPVPGEALPSKT